MSNKVLSKAGFYVFEEQAADFCDLPRFLSRKEKCGGRAVDCQSGQGNVTVVFWDESVLPLLIQKIFLLHLFFVCGKVMLRHKVNDFSNQRESLGKSALS